jgi:beta-lactam-binding protein with PASTA domain
VGTESRTVPAVDHVIDLTEPTLTGVGGGGEVQATISVGGDLSGQVAIGNNIVQVRVDTLHGNLVMAAPATAAPTVLRRPAPVRLVPRRPNPFVSRESELGRVVETLLAADVLDVSGPAGSGRSTLLRQAAHDDRLQALPAGVVHLSCADEGPDDLARSLFDTFYETSAPYQPSRGELRQRLNDVDAGLLLDDVALSADEVDRILDLVPRSGVALTSDDPVLASCLPLGPLPQPAAVVLVRAVSTVDEETAAEIVASPVSPEALLRAAAELSEEEPDEDDRRAFGLLAAVPGLRVDADLLRVLGAGEEADGLVEQLVSRGLARRHRGWGGTADRFSAVPEATTGHPAIELAAARERIDQHFGAWAHRNRHAVPAPSNELEAARQLLAEAVQEEGWGLALDLALALESTFAVTGRWEAWRETLELLERAASATGAEDALAFAHHQQGVLEICEGHRAAGVSLLERALTARERLGDEAGAAVTRANLRLFAPPPPATQGSPTPGPWLALLVVTAVILGATLAWRYTIDSWPFEPEAANDEIEEPEQALVTVPDVVGLSQEEAQQRLARVGLLAEVPGAAGPGSADDLVAEQQPAAGAEVAADTIITLRIGRPEVGPSDEDGPDDGPPDDAEAAGEDRNDVSDDTEADDPDADTGLRVTGETGRDPGLDPDPTPDPSPVPTVPTPVPTPTPTPTTTPTPVATATPDPPIRVRVPDVIGRAAGEALDLIAVAGLNLVSDPLVTSAHEPGFVLDQEPSPDELVDPGTVVRISVSDREGGGRGIEGFTFEECVAALAANSGAALSDEQRAELQAMDLDAATPAKEVFERLFGDAGDPVFVVGSEITLAELCSFYGVNVLPLLLAQQAGRDGPLETCMVARAAALGVRLSDEQRVLLRKLRLTGSTPAVSVVERLFGSTGGPFEVEAGVTMTQFCADGDGEGSRPVLGVRADRHPVSGADVLLLTVLGAALLGLGSVALRRTRTQAD